MTRYESTVKVGSFDSQTSYTDARGTAVHDNRKSSRRTGNVTDPLSSAAPAVVETDTTKVVLDGTPVTVKVPLRSVLVSPEMVTLEPMGRV